MPGDLEASSFLGSGWTIPHNLILYINYPLPNNLNAALEMLAMFL
jgi:hypothetical protein